MDEKTLTALKQSIAHWERLASGDADPDREEVGPHQCALCKLFWKRFPDTSSRVISAVKINCAGCPVHAHTGVHGCRATPFDYVMTVLENYEDNGAQWAAIAKMDDFKAAAADELAFLKTLLPT